MTVTDNDLLTFYKRNKAKFANDKELSLQECLIPYADNEKSALQLADAFQKDPKKFEECVHKHSKAPSAANDGMLGSFKRDQMPDDVSQKVFNLQKGQVAVIERPAAVQLLKAVSVTDHGPISFEKIKPQLKDDYEQEVMEKEFKRLLVDLRSKTSIKTAAYQKWSRSRPP